MLNHSFTVKYITSRNCFLTLSEPNMKKLSYNKIVKLQHGSKELYFSCIQSARINDNNIVGIPSSYAKVLGIHEYESVFLNDVIRLPLLGQITVSPVSFEDYEILQTAASQVQETLLDQIKVVNKNQKLVIWISKWLHAAVKIDSCDNLQNGVLANLTEVHITHPYSVEPKTRTEQEKNVEPKKNSTSEKMERNTLQSPQILESQELNTLQKYVKNMATVVYRVHPIMLPQNLNKNDQILTQPFNLFIYKRDLPNFISTDNLKDILLCKIAKIDPPIDFRVPKEDTVNQKSDIIVRICVIDQFIRNFSNSVRQCFNENNLSKKYPIMFVPEKTMANFNIIVGSKVTLGNCFEFQSSILSVEVSSPNKKQKNLASVFKNYIAEQVKIGKCILNANFCIEMQPNVVGYLTFNPTSDFCIFDENLLQGITVYENNDRKVLHENSEINQTLIDGKDMLEFDGFDRILKQAQRMLNIRNSNENVFIVGKPGSGKTTLTKLICQNLVENPTYTHIVYKSCKKLKGKTVETLYKTFTQDFQNMVYYQPSILVLDDLHIICGKSESATEVQTQESLYFSRVSEMLSELIENCQKNNKISVISTCESTLKINDNILSPRGKHLFKNIYTIPELTKREREIILEKLFLKSAQVEKDILFDELSVKTEGFVIQDLVDFVTKTIFESIKRDAKNNQEKPVVTNEDADTAYKSAVTLALRDVRLHSPGDKNFKDVGGLEDVKKVLVESMRWPAQYPGLFENAPLRLQSGMLLYGPPGVGKTLLVGATAKQCGLRLITVKGPELLSKYVGASEQAVRAIFEKAQSAKPCILFFDEFDSLAPRRGHDSTGVTDRVVNQLLTQLDGVESLTGVFVIAATSRPDLLDPALLRPGRLDRQLLCTVPEQSARLAILKALSRNLVLSKDVELKKIATSTKGFSGADLQAVLYTAQLLAVEHLLASGKEVNSDKAIVTSRHMEEALRNTRPSLTKPEIQKYDKIYAKFQGKKEENDVTTIKKQRATLA